MKNVILQFENAKELRRFAQTVDCTYLDLNLSNLTLTGSCREDELQLAISTFNAKVINNPNETS